MKISLEWLGDYVTWIEHDPLKIADRLTLRTAEVEEVEVQGKLLEHCCVGEVLSVERHPSADRLSVCTVQTDKGKKTVVCGGTNVRSGMLVAFAHVGATVKWHGEGLQTLERVKIRGVDSEGMICAAEELELETMFPPKKEDGERPVVDFSQLRATSYELRVGSSLRDALALTDVVLHLNNTALTMRPDLFSHIGVARECVALGLAKWKKEPALATAKFPKTKGITMHVECAALVPRYLGCTIDIDAIDETPSWMKRRLMALGLRPINLPVDITNYVASEIGVPLHSFDIDDLRGDIHLRLSKKGESITTLDGVERSLPDGALVLSDGQGIFDLLGIMGGLRSSTKASTRHIYLHAAALDPATIRRAVMATGHRTDAATVYEKGVAPITTEQGFFRALTLMLELMPGALIASSLENKGTNGKVSAIALSLDRVHQLLGAAIGEKTIVKILTDLGCTVEETRDKRQETSKRKNKKSLHLASCILHVSIPAHRLRDLRGEHDLIEEVGRVYGYENIQDAMPVAPIQIPKRDERLHKIRDALKAANFFEIVPLSFVSPELLRRCATATENAIAIENPLGEETSLLQTSTLPHLLTHAQQNFLGAQGPLKTFHCAHVFEKGKQEHLELGLLVSAKAATDLVHDPFLIAKENLLNACNDAGYELSIVLPSATPPFAHPGRCAALLHQKKECGWIFEIHPAIRSAFDLPHRCAAIILNLTSLLKDSPLQKIAAPLPAFPAVTYDETIARSHTQSIEKLLQTSRAASTLLEDVHIHDLYQSKNSVIPSVVEERLIPNYNVTFRFTYRAQDRTLTEEEAKVEHGRVMAKMATI